MARNMTESSLISRAASRAATLWNEAARLRVGLYQRGWLRQKRLHAKVISVGNIAWGGTGKTPFTIWLACRLQARGLPVSILTRGYRRASRERVQIISPGTPPGDAADAGDEVQLFLRNLRIPLGVSASRYEAGRLLEAQFPVDVHLLDDGFQHLALHRDLDLALVDAENPWGRRGSFRSLLREAPEALRRADAILLTRCELVPAGSSTDSLASLRAVLERLNPTAPCFPVRTELIGFREHLTNRMLAPEDFRSRRPLAFCALGNPRAFFRTLDRAGISVAGQKVFPDHHRYSVRDLEALAKAAVKAGATGLVATEKDWVNLPPGAHLDLPLYWAVVELHVEQESRLLQWIGDRLELPVVSGSAVADRSEQPSKGLPNAPGAPAPLRREEERNPQPAGYITEPDRPLGIRQTDCPMKPLRKDELARAKILLRAPNWIGDAVMCLPALRALRRALPEADLVVAARPWVLDLFSGDALRVRRVAYDTRGAHRGVAGRWRIASELRGEKFHAAILFQNAFDAAVLAVLAGIPIRAGYARHGRRWLLTHPVEVPRRGETPRQEAHYYLELLRRLGLIEGYSEVREISLPVADSARANARARLAGLLAAGIAESIENKAVVGISPGAAFGTAKRWPAERFAELSLRLSRDLGAVPVFFGSKEEAPLAESLLPKAGAAAVSLAGKTSLGDFMGLIPGCDLYISNDTGAMHVAAAIGVPTLAIFGPTDEQATRPLGRRVHLIVGQAECRPCLLRHCPIDQRSMNYHLCMNSVSVEEVFEAARSLLERSQREYPTETGKNACPTWQEGLAR